MVVCCMLLAALLMLQPLPEAKEHYITAGSQQPAAPGRKACITGAA
jgi:hypothetical protein